MPSFVLMPIIPLEVTGMCWRHRFYPTGLPGWWGMPPVFWGWGAPWWPYPGVPKEMELEWLSAQAEALEKWLSAIKRRIEELSKEG